MPSRWLNKQQSLDYLGISEEKFDQLVTAGWIRFRGKTSGRRFDAETIQAIGVLWERLDDLLSEDESPAEAE
jgi:hypothetical protein